MWRNRKTDNEVRVLFILALWVSMLIVWFQQESVVYNNTRESLTVFPVYHNHIVAVSYLYGLWRMFTPFINCHLKIYFFMISSARYHDISIIMCYF